METWILNHPDVGEIKVEKGFDAEFSAHATPENPWPGEIPKAKDGKPKDYVVVGPDAGLKERFSAFVDNPSVRVQISVNGEVRRQLTGVPSGKAMISKKIEPELTMAETPGAGKPCLKFTKAMDDELLMVEYRDGDEVVEFVPPAGSRGERRVQAMEESSFKRWFYPLLAGLGKGGWALAVLVLGPLLSRLISWLLGFLPDWDLPDWELPSPPSIELPAVTMPSPPSIELPVIPMPDWNLPSFDLPDWVEFLIDHSRIWVPVVIGIVIGITAIRNHRKSEATKQQWKGSALESSAQPAPRTGLHQRHHGVDKPRPGTDKTLHAPGEEGEDDFFGPGAESGDNGIRNDLRGD